MAAPGIKGSVALSAELRKLAAEVHTIDNNGDQVTREEALAAMIWKQALGWIEEVRDDDGTLRKVTHPPVAWCQQFLFERIEGKAQVSTEQTGAKVTAREKVGELARDRLNALAKAAIKGPPKHVAK